LREAIATGFIAAEEVCAKSGGGSPSLSET
jgi:hypothetical protein